MTFQRKLLLGFALMVLPALLVGAEAIRSNVLERRALTVLGENMARTRTYAELETAMFDQTEIVWRYLSGLDPTARREFALQGQVVATWQGRWEAELRPEERELAARVARIQQQITVVTDSVFALADAGQREAAFRLARVALRERLLPALTQTNREIYRQARESSVRGAFTRLEEILADERRILAGVFGLAIALGLGASWFIARSLGRPIAELRQAMATVGAGRLDARITPRTDDEIGDLARSFTAMTERLRESRAEVERAQAQLVQSEKLASIGEMAAAVAHGLRNPLASLRAAAQFVRRHPASPAAGEQLGAIIDEVDRLDRRISHLLSFARPAPFHATPQPLARVVEAVLPGLAEALREKRIAVAVDVPAALPELRVDPMQLEQALLEIMTNAVDAMQTGGALAVTGRAATDADGSPAVTLTVTDTGPGIPPDVLPSVCEPFFTTRQEGTGLGLAIARRYIEQNGGTLGIESAPGAGTTVTLRFPAPALPADDGADAADPWRLPADRTTTDAAPRA